MSDIFREVDEALQKEKVEKLWKEYGPTLLLAAVVMVVSTGVITAYKSWNSHVNKQETAKLVMAAEDKNVVASMEKAASDTRDGQKTVALMTAASKAAIDKDFTKAQSLYESIAKDKSAPKDLRDLSIIFLSRTKQMTTSDKAPDYKSLVEILKPVADSTRSPFQALAKLEIAALYGDGLKDYSNALLYLKDFEASTTPSDSIKEKALALKRVYTYEQSKTTKGDK